VVKGEMDLLEDTTKSVEKPYIEVRVNKGWANYPPTTYRPLTEPPSIAYRLY
jgi:hypothetical protein